MESIHSFDAVVIASTPPMFVVVGVARLSTLLVSMRPTPTVNATA
jgi:hypothetical protein